MAATDIGRSCRIDTLQTVELAEGVEIGLRVAGPLPRILAYLVDFFIRLAVVVSCGLALGFAGILVSEAITTGLLLILWFAIEWLYPVLFEAGKHGATPGKRWLGLKVVQTNGSPIGFSQSVIRNFLRAADAMPGFTYFFGLVCCVASRRFQRLGDIVAGTLVVYAGSQDAPLVKGPPPVGRRSFAVALSAEEKRAIASFRERAALWSPGRQVELADHLSLLTEIAGPEGVRRLMEVAGQLQGGRGQTQ